MIKVQISYNLGVCALILSFHHLFSFFIRWRGKTKMLPEVRFKTRHDQYTRSAASRTQRMMGMHGQMGSASLCFAVTRKRVDTICPQDLSLCPEDLSFETISRPHRLCDTTMLQNTPIFYPERFHWNKTQRDEVSGKNLRATVKATKKTPKNSHNTKMWLVKRFGPINANEVNLLTEVSPAPQLQTDPSAEIPVIRADKSWGRSTLCSLKPHEKFGSIEFAGWCERPCTWAVVHARCEVQARTVKVICHCRERNGQNIWHPLLLPHKIN